MEAKQHLTRITKEQADMFVETDLAHPRVFKGDDGSYWIKSDELCAYTSQATSVKTAVKP